MFKKTLFKKIIFAVLGLVFSVLSFVITINSYNTIKITHIFVLIFFVLAVFSMIVCIFYTYYAYKARKYKGYKGRGYIIIFIYVILISILVIYSIISSMGDIYGKELFEKYGVLTFSGHEANFSGAFVFGFVVIIIAEVIFTIYYLVDLVLTIKNLFVVKKQEKNS